MKTIGRLGRGAHRQFLERLCGAAQISSAVGYVLETAGQRQGRKQLVLEVARSSGEMNRVGVGIESTDDVVAFTDDRELRSRAPGEVTICDVSSAVGSRF